MANTFELIASSTVGAGGASSIDFTSIPSTYTDLVLLGSTRNNESHIYGDVYVLFNGASTNRSARYLEGSGSAASSGTQSSNGVGSNQGNSATANTFSNFQLYIPNYAGSNNKSSSADGVSENNATTAYATFTANLWSQTAAINQITLTTTVSYSFQEHSTAYLYGVKNA
jgi:hypothetical protein